MGRAGGEGGLEGAERGRDSGGKGSEPIKLEFKVSLAKQAF
jgi:hypothetical protein